MSRAASISNPGDHLRSATSPQTIGQSELVISARQSQDWTGQQIADGVMLVLADAGAFCIAIGAGAAAANVFNLVTL